MDEKDVCIKQYKWFERVCKKHQYKAKTIQLWLFDVISFNWVFCEQVEKMKTFF